MKEYKVSEWASDHYVSRLAISRVKINRVNIIYLYFISNINLNVDSTMFKLFKFKSYCSGKSVSYLLVIRLCVCVVRLYLE